MGRWAWELSQCVKVLTAEPSEQTHIYFRIPKGERKEPVPMSFPYKHGPDILSPREYHSVH